MKSKSVIEKLRKIMIVFLVILVCMSNMAYATEVIATASPTTGSDSGGETEEVEERDPNLPYMEMYVRPVKISDEDRQIIVEWWAYKVTDMQAFDIRFTYNSDYLQPSYIEADMENGIEKNTILQGINSIKYEERSNAVDEDDFDDNAMKTLINSFKFNANDEDLGDIGEILEVQKLRYLPSQIKEIEKTEIDANTGEATTVTESIEYEKLQFVVSKQSETEIETADPEEETTNTNEENTNTGNTNEGNTNTGNTNTQNTNSGGTNTEETKRREITTIDPEKPIHIGTFSFKVLNQSALIEEGSFETTKVTITCNDKEEGDYTTYERDEEYENSEEDGEDIAKFVYEKFGSISGEIVTAYYKNENEIVKTTLGTSRRPAKKTATIYIYKADDVAGLNWNATGTRKYTNNIRKKLIPFVIGTYTYACIPDTNNKNRIPIAYEYEMTQQDKGIFKIDNIKFGDYVVFIDKYNFADSIITNITVDFYNRDIDLGKIELFAGDLNKDGVFTSTGDGQAFMDLMRLDADANGEEEDKDLLSSFNLQFAYDLNDDGAQAADGDRQIFLHTMKLEENYVLKQVIDYKNEIYNNKEEEK